jgi:hypothetical protein
MASKGKLSCQVDDDDEEDEQNQEVAESDKQPNASSLDMSMSDLALSSDSNAVAILHKKKNHGHYRTSASRTSSRDTAMPSPSSEEDEQQQASDALLPQLKQRKRSLPSSSFEVSAPKPESVLSPSTQTDHEAVWRSVLPPCVSVTTSETRGRGLVSTAALSLGVEVMSCSPYALVLDAKSRKITCHHCLRVASKMKQCTACKVCWASIRRLRHRHVHSDVS